MHILLAVLGSLHQAIPEVRPLNLKPVNSHLSQADLNETLFSDSLRPKPRSPLLIWINTFWVFFFFCRGSYSWSHLYYFKCLKALFCLVLLVFGIFSPFLASQCYYKLRLWSAVFTHMTSIIEFPFFGCR